MISVVPFEPNYAEDLFRISLATGHFGADASGLYSDPTLMGLIYSAPYAALAPSLVVLAVDGEGVAGFAAGVADTAAWEDDLERSWWPRLRPKYPDPDLIPPTERTQDQRRHHMIHHPSRVPGDISQAYPAHLHLNLLPRVQGRGLGLQLFTAWLDAVAPYSPAGVHVGVNRQNTKATRFWTRCGFKALELTPLQSGRTVWMGRTLF